MWSRILITVAGRRAEHLGGAHASPREVVSFHEAGHCIAAAALREPAASAAVWDTGGGLTAYSDRTDAADSGAGSAVPSDDRQAWGMAAQVLSIGGARVCAESVRWLIRHAEREADYILNTRYWRVRLLARELEACGVLRGGELAALSGEPCLISAYARERYGLPAVGALMVEAARRWPAQMTSLLREEGRRRMSEGGSVGGQIAGRGRPENRGYPMSDNPYPKDEPEDLEPFHVLEVAAKAVGVSASTAFRAVKVLEVGSE